MKYCKRKLYKHEWDTEGGNVVIDCCGSVDHRCEWVRNKDLDV